MAQRKLDLRAEREVISIVRPSSTFSTLVLPSPRFAVHRRRLLDENDSI